MAPHPTVQPIQIFLAFLLLGAFSQIAQGMMARELLVAFFGNEISLGAFYGGWLFWIGVGGWLVLRQDQRHPLLHPLRLTNRLLLLLPPALVGQIALLRLILLYFPPATGTFAPMGEMALVTLLVTLPLGLVLGALLPVAALVAQREPGTTTAIETNALTKLFALEAVGAVLGGVLFALVLVELASPWRVLGGLALAMAGMVFALATGQRLERGLALLMAVLALALVSPLGQRLDLPLEQLRFNAMHPGLTLLERVETRFGQVSAARLGEQISITVDGRVAESFPDTNTARLDAAYYHAQASAPQRVLVLGGGLYNGLVEALLQYPIAHLDLVLEDATAFQRILPLLPTSTQAVLNEPRVTLHFADARRFVNQLAAGPGYDLIISLVTDPTSTRQNRSFTHEFFQSVRQGVTAKGVFCTRISSASNYLGREMKSYGGSLYTTLRRSFSHIALAPGDILTVCASPDSGQVTEQPGELVNRYRARPPQDGGIAPTLFYSLLQTERLHYVRSRLTTETGLLNSDQQPVTFFLNLMIWGQFTNTHLGEGLLVLQRLGVWSVLVPAGLLALFLLLRPTTDLNNPLALRRGAAAYALAMLGFVAMAAEMMILFAYQARIGFVFSRIALLNGLFMLGLAGGAALGGWLAARGRSLWALLALLLVTAGYCLLLPTLLAALPEQHGELLFLLLTLATGMVTGTGFPLAATCAHDSGQRLTGAGGLAVAADHLGGAMGGLLTGTLLVPMLGVTATSQVLAVLAGLALFPLLALERWPRLPGWWRLRSRPSFPVTLGVRTVWFVTLCLLLLSLLARSALPPPQNSFSAELLHELSERTHFTRFEQPFPHDVGQMTQETPATAALVASQVVAGAVQGYAGPLNLLVAVDDHGKLLGARHIASRETPSYIQEINTWLAGLRGWDLSQEPLSLQRLEAMSGATVSSRAALESINQAAAISSREAFGRTLPQRPDAIAPWWTPRFASILLLLLLVVPIYWLGRANQRTGLLGLALLSSGLLFNTQVTELDLANASLGLWPTWQGNPVGALLLGAVLVLTLLLGPVYCGYLCPFGALQEFISRLGARWRLRPSPRLDRTVRQGRYLLLAVALTGVWLSGDGFWISFNPMQSLFSGAISLWLGVLTGLIVVGSIFYFRFWCRALCPLGAALALGNKLALLERHAPPRRFPGCDLGAEHPFDVECLRCNRCLPVIGTNSYQNGEKKGIMAPVRPTQRHSDPLFITLLLLCLLVISLHLGASWEQSHRNVGGWRVVDTAKVQAALDQGRLAEHEAQWYRKTDLPGGPAVLEKP